MEGGAAIEQLSHHFMCQRWETWREFAELELS